MSRSRLPSRLAIWQLACRVLSFIADTIIFAIFLWSSIRSHYFSIPAYIGLGFAYLIDVEEILALTNKKRTIRRWWTLWIIFLDLLAAGLFWAGPFSLIQWPAVPKPDRNLPPSEVAPHDDQLPLVIAFFTGFALHGLFIPFYGVAWIVSSVRRRRRDRSMRLTKLDTLDQASVDTR